MFDQRSVREQLSGKVVKMERTMVKGITNQIDDLFPVYGSKTDYTPTGLKNLKNTCYMNSVLQCLVNTDELVHQLMALSPIVRAITNKPKTILEELRFLIMILRSGEFRSVSPVKFRKQLVELSQQYCGNQQQDAHELLHLLLVSK